MSNTDAAIAGSRSVESSLRMTVRPRGLDLGESFVDQLAMGRLRDAAAQRLRGCERGQLGGLRPDPLDRLGGLHLDLALEPFTLGLDFAARLRGDFICRGLSDLAGLVDDLASL